MAHQIALAKYLGLHVFVRIKVQAYHERMRIHNVFDEQRFLDTVTTQYLSLGDEVIIS